MLHIDKRRFLDGSALATAGELARIFDRVTRGGCRAVGITPRQLRALMTGDQMMTLDHQLAQQYGSVVTADSTGVFLVSQLEKLDRVLNEPLYSVTWSRDIELRTDVSMGDEIASWTNSTYATPGGLAPGGVNWISSNTNAVPGPAIDIGKTPQPLHPWGIELGWTVFELAKGAVLGQPIDTAKYEAMDTKWQMDVDQVVYTGESLFTQYGLLNSPAVSVSNVVNGASASPLWINKTPQEKLNDVNTLLNNQWAATGWSVMADELRLPPTQFLALNATIVSSAGSMSVLKFLRENNASVAITGKPLNIQPLKWLTGRGVSGADRMFAYTKDPKRVRYPLVPRQRTPLELRSIYQLTTYYGKLGFVEWRYPETAAYADGI